jgi:hypothetical protein
MEGSMKVLRVGAVVLLLAAGARRSDAQVLYGSLVGSVTDAAAAAIPNASVEATNTSTGITKRASTDERGAYLFSDLQPGAYDIRVTAPSFSTFTKTGVAISPNTVVRVDVQLQVGTVTENITVSAAATVLQTDRSDMNAQISGRQVRDLPLPGMRTFQALLKLVPGITPPRASNSDFANPQGSLVVNTNGSSFSTNNTRLDGAGDTYVWLPHHAAYVPSADAVETVNVVTNSFDAEQGLAGGAVVNVNIKSGTNDFHGSVFEYHTNSKLRARNFFYLGNRLPKNILNQYGFTIGGPVIRNKLFFFGDLESTRRRQNGSGFVTLPTAAMRTGDFSATGTNIYDPQTGSADGSGRQLFPGNRIPTARFDPAAQKLVALVPAPNLSGDSNNFFYSDSLRFNRDTGDVKVNFNPTTRISMFGRYSILDFFIFDPQILGAAGGDPAGGGQPGTGSGRIQSTTLGGTVIFTPHLLMDGHIGYTRRSDAQTAEDFGKNYGLDVLGIPGTNGGDVRESGYPRFTISGFAGYGNLSTSSPSFHIDSQFVYNFNFSYTTGAHSLRWGVDIDRQHMNHWQPEVGGYGPRGGFNFNGGLTALRGGTPPNRFNAYSDFLLGLPIDMGKSREEFGVMSTRGWAEALYIRDQWQATRNLTINYGLRWEYYPFSTRDHRGQERYDPATNKVLLGGIGSVPTDTGVEVSKRQFGPRLGLAWRVQQKWVLRAGFGISIDPYPLSRPLRDNYPTVTNSQFQGASSLEAGGNLRTGIPVIPRVDVGNGIIPIPAVATTNTLDRVFRRGYVESFNATVERELPAGFVGRLSYVGTRGIRQMVFININAAAPGTGAAGRALNILWGRTADTRAVTPFRTSDYNALQAHAERRFSRGFQVSAAYTFSKAIAYNDNSDAALDFNWPDAFGHNRARTGYDRPHNLQVSGIAELPFGKGHALAQAGWKARVLGGWQLNGIFSAYSGTPFTVGSSNASLNAPGNNQTADQVVSEVKILGGIGRGSSFFDPYAFAPVTAVRFGNTGRNILRGPGVVNVDASLFRTFSFTDRWKMQFRAESFNFTNTPHFNNPGTSVSGATRNPDGTIRSLGGYTEVTAAAADERQFRFSLRVSF